MSNKNRKYFIGGYDVSSSVRVDGATPPRGQISKPEWGELPETPRLQFNLINDRGQFSTRSNISILYNKRGYDTPVKVNSVLGAVTFPEWFGFIETIQEDYSADMVTITGVTPWQRLINNTANITLAKTTPAALSKAVFQLFDIPINETSFDIASDYQLNLVNCVLDPNIFESQITLMELQKQLATVGIGRIFPTPDGMFYEVYTGDPGAVSFALVNRDIMLNPSITNVENESQAYTVNWTGGSVTSVNYVNGESTQSLDFGPSATVKVVEQSSALHIADQWEELSQRTYYDISFAVLPEIGNSMSLSTWVDFTWTEANFDSVRMEIVGLDYTDPKYVQVVGRVNI